MNFIGETHPKERRTRRAQRARPHTIYTNFIYTNLMLFSLKMG